MEGSQRHDTRHSRSPRPYHSLALSHGRISLDWTLELIDKTNDATPSATVRVKRKRERGRDAHSKNNEGYLRAREVLYLKKIIY